MATIIIGGVRYATPERFRREGDALWGYFLADDSSQYDQWMYWGEATRDNIRAIREAGVLIESASAE